jgi:hypothetical protein
MKNFFIKNLLLKKIKINVLSLTLILIFICGMISCQATTSTKILKSQYGQNSYAESVKSDIKTYTIEDNRFETNVRHGQIIITNNIKKTAVSMSPNNIYFMGAGVIVEIYVDVNGDLMARSGESIRKIADF